MMERCKKAMGEHEQMMSRMMEHMQMGDMQAMQPSMQMCPMTMGLGR